MRIEAYWNVRKKMFSVRALDGPQKGRVINHLADVRLQDATFHVSEYGRLRVLSEKRNNFHAVVRGNLVTNGRAAEFKWAWDKCRAAWDSVNYNPYYDTAFHHEGFPVERARFVKLGVYYTTLGRRADGFGFETLARGRIAAYEVE